MKKQEELRQKLEKEELERRLREENEKKKAEMEERLKLEESERIARKKRVEAIMQRTLGKGSPGSQNKVVISSKILIALAFFQYKNLYCFFFLSRKVIIMRRITLKMKTNQIL